MILYIKSIRFADILLFFFCETVTVKALLIIVLDFWYFTRKLKYEVVEKKAYFKVPTAHVAFLRNTTLHLQKYCDVAFTKVL